jgi:hypothetical protein
VGLVKGVIVWKALRVARLVVGLAFVAMLVFGPALIATADAGVIVAQETPYEAPEIQEVETPGWLRMFEPLAALPLWGQAAVLSAGVAGMFFVVPMVFRWVWSLGPDNEPEDEGGDQP